MRKLADRIELSIFGGRYEHDPLSLDIRCRECGRRINLDGEPMRDSDDLPQIPAASLDQLVMAAAWHEDWCAPTPRSPWERLRNWLWSWTVR